MTMHQTWGAKEKSATAPMPHVGNCSGCRTERQCNVCGSLVGLMGGCTNGRCLNCHIKICTNIGVGHGYGDPTKAVRP